MTTEVGHHVSRVYRSQDGDLIASSGAAVKIEPKGVLSVASSGEFRMNDVVTHTTANLTLEPHGVKILDNTTQCVFLTKAPTVGAQMKLVFTSTASAMVRLSTGAVNAYPVRIAGGAKSSVCVVKCTSDAWIGKRAFGNMTVELLATASSAWRMMSVTYMSTGAVSKVFAVSSST